MNTTKHDYPSFKPIKLICEFCKSDFYIPSFRVKANIKKYGYSQKFCSIQCCGKYNSGELHYRKTVPIICNCLNCNKPFEKSYTEFNRSKNKKHFCSKSCAAKYNNTHKSHGYRRSKLEIWIEEQLTKLYPKLKIEFNKIETINSELDIYIPSLKLAFEFNGVFHYEPIYGKEKLGKIQNNDNRKFQACLEKNIELCIIDVSKIKYIKEKTSRPILEGIQNIINKKLDANVQ
jgi:hypothetical protein